MVAGYTGLLRATQRPDGSSPLPGRFLMRSHISCGTTYYAMIYIGLLFGWAVHEFLLEQPVLPDGPFKVHVVLAVAIGVLYGVAWILGSQMTREAAGPRRLRPRLHMVANFTACTLVAVQIVLAASYVWIRPG